MYIARKLVSCYVLLTLSLYVHHQGQNNRQQQLMRSKQNGTRQSGCDIGYISSKDAVYWKAFPINILPSKW